MIMFRRICCIGIIFLTANIPFLKAGGIGLFWRVLCVPAFIAVNIMHSSYARCNTSLLSGSERIMACESWMYNPCGSDHLLERHPARILHFLADWTEMADYWGGLRVDASSTFGCPVQDHTGGIL